MYGDPVFGFRMPLEVPGVPKEILNPRLTWSDPADYDNQNRRLALLFCENLVQYMDNCLEHVIGAGPIVG